MKMNIKLVVAALSVGGLFSANVMAQRGPAREVEKRTIEKKAEVGKREITSGRRVGAIGGALLGAATLAAPVGGINYSGHPMTNISQTNSVENLGKICGVNPNANAPEIMTHVDNALAASVVGGAKAPAKALAIAWASMGVSPMVQTDAGIKTTEELYIQTVRDNALDTALIAGHAIATTAQLKAIESVKNDPDWASMIEACRAGAATACGLVADAVNDLGVYRVVASAICGVADPALCAAAKEFKEQECVTSMGLGAKS